MHVDNDLGVIQQRFQSTCTNHLERQTVERLRDKDPTVWSSNTDVAGDILNRLGWLDAPVTFRPRLDELRRWASAARAQGLRRAVVLGMGGSSLAPEVFANLWRNPEVQLDILDNTATEAVRHAWQQSPPEQTIYIVSSKSGTTTETLAFFEYFHAQAVAILGDAAGRHFVAITDAGSALERRAIEHDFQQIFLNPTDIGGRFSALSYFGLVPAALLDIDLSRLLNSAEQEMQRCADPNSAAAKLGYALGTAIEMGRDKLMLVMSETLCPLSAWIEQLIAESLGKQGMGSVPVRAEPAIGVTDNLDDRFYILLDSGSHDPTIQALHQQLLDVGCPVMRRSVLDRYDLGREYFTWEFATAIAAAVLQLNPFDEPDVAVSKTMTCNVLEDAQASGRQADENTGTALTPSADHPLFAGCGDPASYLRELLNSVQTGDYFALLAFLPATASVEDFLRTRARVLATHLGCVVSTGIGPRYLHSTGQLHKGGANNGVFLLLSANSADDIDIPGQHYTFGQLNQAQASGDFKVLQARQRRVLRIHLGAHIEQNLECLTELIDAELLRRQSANI
ncbi:MAG: hypothetical protein OEQ39_16700 [Gammaproteobacteria bacterium]|nr:hypothetical protein [Gammaproteobacteria bacterium]